MASILRFLLLLVLIINFVMIPSAIGMKSSSESDSSSSSESRERTHTSGSRSRYDSSGNTSKMDSDEDTGGGMADSDTRSGTSTRLTPESRETASVTPKSKSSISTSAETNSRERTHDSESRSSDDSRDSTDSDTSGMDSTEDGDSGMTDSETSSGTNTRLTPESRETASVTPKSKRSSSTSPENNSSERTHDGGSRASDDSRDSTDGGTSGTDSAKDMDSGMTDSEARSDTNTRLTPESRETTSVTPADIHPPIRPCRGGNFSLHGVSLSFPTSEFNATVNSTQRCPPGSTNTSFPLALRRCKIEWENPEFNKCFNQQDLKSELERISKTMMNGTVGNISDIVLVLLLATNQPEDLTVEEVDLIQQILSMVVEMNDESPQTTDSIVGVIDSITELEEDILNQIPNPAGFVENLEDQVASTQKSPKNYSETLDNLAVEAVKVDRSFLERPYKFNNPLKRKREGGDQFRSSSITLPPAVLDIIDKTLLDIEKIPLTFLAFRESNLFVTKQQRQKPTTRHVIISQVVSASVELDVNITNLPPSSPVVIRFESENDPAKGEFKGEATCVFWEYSDETRQGNWSTAGCMTQQEGKEIMCFCNHLTSFAVLFSETMDEERYHLALHYVTYIGCAISIACLTVCLGIMLLIKPVRVRQQTHIHINLCIALLALYMTFLLGVDKTENPVTCKVISAVIHFLCLCVMAWMSVEAYSIYKIIWKVQLSNIRHLVLVASIFAWGIPAVVAILVFFFDNSHNYEAEPDYCFLHQGHGFYFGFLTIGGILTLYNSFVFVLAVYRINCRKINGTEKSERRDEVVRRVASSFLFWVLLGLSWIFGYFSSFTSPTSQPFQLLFCIFLSLQGFFMFCLLVLQNAQLKNQIIKLYQNKVGKYTVSKTRLFPFLHKRSNPASANTYETNTNGESK